MVNEKLYRLVLYKCGLVILTLSAPLALFDALTVPN